MIKMTIGEIADRYTICKLKSERTEVDCSAELSLLKQEVDQYTDIQLFIDELYKINGTIWTLESDLRKGKENILGLEEVGRRAIQIRNHNGERVRVKNEINIKYKEGFVETKVDHCSQSAPSVIITLTTVPERLASTHPDGFMGALRSLCTQNATNYEVHINIPHVYRVTNQQYILPDWFISMQREFSNLKTYRVEDYGPPTKIIPTLKRVSNPDTLIIIADDDLMYHSDMINEHVKYQSTIGGVIGYDGRGSRTEPKYNDLRDSWVLCTERTTRVDFLQCYKSVSVKKSYFEEDFFTDWVGKTKSDDVLLSYYFRYKEIPMYVVPYEPDVHLLSSYESWGAHQGVTTFPVLCHTYETRDTGCNHPELLKTEPKFFVPPEFEELVANK